MVCLDTDVIIDFLRNDKAAVEKISKIKKDDINLSTTSINTFELLRGALQSKQEGAVNHLLGLLDNFEIFVFDFSASRKAAEILEELRATGKIIDHSDLMIASIAIVNDESLITRNIKHFEKVRELKLEEI